MKLFPSFWFAEDASYQCSPHVHIAFSHFYQFHHGISIPVPIKYSFIILAGVIIRHEL